MKGLSGLPGYYNRYWEGVAADAPPHHRAWTEQRIARLRAALAHLPGGARILDAGCGRGAFSAVLADLGFRVTGVDLSPLALAQAKARNAGRARGLVAASLERALPFAPGVFAAIWCTEVLEHLFDVHGALSALNRVCAPGGLLALTVPHHGVVKNVVIALAGFEKHYDPYASHIRFYNRRSLGLCLQNAGFAPISWHGVGRFWPLWMSDFVVARKAGPPGPARVLV